MSIRAFAPFGICCVGDWASWCGRGRACLDRICVCGTPIESHVHGMKVQNRHVPITAYASDTITTARPTGVMTTTSAAAALLSAAADNADEALGPAALALALALGGARRKDTAAANQ